MSEPRVMAFILLFTSIALIAAATRWRRPQVSGKFRSLLVTGTWVMGTAVLTAGAVSFLRAALGFAIADATLAGPAAILLRLDVIALIGIVLLICFAEVETNRLLLLLGAAVGSGLTVACSPLFERLAFDLQPGPVAAALVGAVLAPVLLSTGSRATLITRIRKAAMTASGDHILVSDSMGRLLYVTAEARKALGLREPSGANRSLPRALKAMVEEGEPGRRRLRTKSGRILEAWSTGGAARGSLKRARGVLIRDVTGRYEDERRLVRLAHYDSLTGLANRRLFLENLAEVLEGARRASASAALFYIDLDDFKAINDSLGHGAGDTLLEELADRFRTHLRPEEVAQFGISGAPLSVARLSGDEFAVIAPRLRNARAAYELARWILELIGQPVELFDRTINASASVGIALYPEDGQDLDTLIRHADTALYAAKSKGRRRFARYEASFDHDANRGRELETGLRGAIDRDELRLFYQPKIDLRTGTVVGFEALMRWRSPELGDVGPAEFIPVAEDRGLISELGTWGLNRACRQIKEWTEAGYTIVPVAVNVSSRQFTENDLQSVVSDALKQYEVDPHYLELELTESLLLGESDNVDLVLRDLRSIGIRIALDDFGTGYSALTYLNRFNLDVLKMDRGLLRDIDSNPSAMGIASAVVAMAHSLGLTVVAEGVDCLEQVEILSGMHCDQLQGFLYSPAVPPDEAVRFMARTGEAAPTCSPIGSPVDYPAEAGTSPSDWNELPALHPTSVSGRPEAPKQAATYDRGRVLVVDDENETLGVAALRLSRLGIDTHYAAAIDEAHLLIKQEGDGIRVIVVSPSVDLDSLAGLMAPTGTPDGEHRRSIVIGEQPEEDVRDAIRAAGVDWVLWEPFNDTELRCLIKSALAFPHELADRREPRVPVDLVANVARGSRREVVVVSSLSPRGAFIETDDPLRVGSTLRLEIDMPSDRFRGFARVVHVQHEDPNQPHEPSGMGVSFFGSDRDTERILRKAVSELSARYQP